MPRGVCRHGKKTSKADGSLWHFRDFPEAKLQENLDAEIFGVLAEEAREAYDEGMVVELKSETVDEVDANCDRILEWVKTWQEEHESRQKGQSPS